MSSLNASVAALIQLEQSLNNFQNALYNEQGEIALDARWFEMYDALLKQLISSRALADKAQGALGPVNWNEIDALLYKK